MGDYNREPEEFPLGGMMAVGAVFPMNTAYVPENGTHRNADGELYWRPPGLRHRFSTCSDWPQIPRPSCR